MFEHSKTACMGDNSITQTTHETTHSTLLRKRSNCPGPLPIFIFCTVCDKSWGERSLGWG